MLQLHQLDSQILERKRKIRVFLPDQYDQQPGSEFPVIFKADGQLAFSDRNGELPFGSWQLDVHLQRLIDEGAVPPAVVVAIDNSAKRRQEYFPVTEEFSAYERFLREEVLPWARFEFRISADPRENFVMGSSMGGLASFALVYNNPDIFGAAACLSPWFEHEQSRYINEFLRSATEKRPVRFYLDSGIQDWRMLDDGHRGTLLARLELLRMGYEEGKDFVFHRDVNFATLQELEGSLVRPEKREEATRSQHNEFYFSRRTPAALRFLLAAAAD